MTATTLTNAQHRVLEDAANFPDSPVEKFMLHLPAGARKIMTVALIKKGCLEQRGQKHFITATGCNAVGHEATPPAPELKTAKPDGKQAMILDLLKREEGTTIAQLIDATGWKSHSVRGYLSNLRKKRGLPIETFTTREGARGYRIEATG